VNRLRQVAHLLRHLMQRPEPLVAAGNRNRSCFRPAKAGDDVEQSTFPGAVHPQKREKLAFAGAEGSRVQNRASPVGKADTLDL